MTGGHDDRREPGEHAEGGDPVCWLDRVCVTCGAMREDMRADRCARCDAPFPGAEHPGGTRQPPAG
ncbi:hypothetical protein [Actinacidiphila paucisporea]|uniref:Uncharacterized protein n=1 Tax=Actinacidiphila paucisporea TaxID=310782 RepID=A0A1M7APA7_9ACTN|nr:hypothetical protein [Actinacidiphila paucisporea]SHL44570.1 hypothetical protein SAMN05216499_104156 [Actinacidiphila paucisporea]